MSSYYCSLCNAKVYVAKATGEHMRMCKCPEDTTIILDFSKVHLRGIGAFRGAWTYDAVLARIKKMFQSVFAAKDNGK
jgi:hypothetical protein